MKIHLSFLIYIALHSSTRIIKDNTRTGDFRRFLISLVDRIMFRINIKLMCSINTRAVW